MSDWLQVRVTVDREHVEVAETALQEAGAVSLTLLDAGDEPVHEPPPDATPVWSRTVVQGLFAADFRHEVLIRRLEAAGLPASKADIETEALPEQDWERAWMDQYRPMQFGRDLWICPWHVEPDPDWPTVIRLDPGLAFGSGTHPTTALCLEWIDGLELSGQRVLDYGCGSGVLAIACALKGAAAVVAVDHDPQALQATRDNAERNGVQETIVTQLPDDFHRAGSGDGSFDLVLANILAGPLIELAPRIINPLSLGGQLVLSGILPEQANAVEQQYSKALEPVVHQSREGWVLLVFNRVA